MIFTPDRVEFLRTGYAKMTVPELTRAYNARFGTGHTECSIHSALSRRRITCCRRGYPRDVYLRVMTPEQATFVAERYREMTLTDVTAALNHRFGTTLTEKHLRHFTRNHRLRSGRTGQYDKGHRPWNHGTKGLMGPNPGNFRKGNIPANWKPLGTERINRDGYVEVKIAERDPYTGSPTRYRLKHVVLWEQAHGPAPDGCVVVFRDGKKLHCEIDNLMLVTRAELMRLNQSHYADLPDDLRPSLAALVKLEVKAFALQREPKP